MLSRHDKYLNYEELTSLLKEFQARFPNFVSLETLGQSKQGREMWLLTLTDSSTGPHYSKPAFWMDGNTHASEVAGAQACLHVIDTLLDQKDSSRVRELLKRFTIYALPRISVDGSELFIQTGYAVRSSIETFPAHIPFERFKTQDMDGDGKIVQMRIPDPAGTFKISKQDPRLMVVREPWDDESEGPFFTLIEEGSLLNFDGFHRQSFVKEKFDLNRQSPAGFTPTQGGAGPLPMYLEEGKIYAKAIVDRPNIFTINTYHTFGAVMLRPSSLRADSHFPTMDLEIFKKMGELAESCTGYKAYSVFHDFNYDPKSVTTGTWDDWHYDHRGILSWTPEIWNVAKKAGIHFDKPLDYYQKLNEEHLLKIIQWCDKNLPAEEYYRDWKKFNHPQFGLVEIGGWIENFVFRNPPPSFLKAELEGLTNFAIKQILMGPQVEISRREVKLVSGGIYQIKIEVRNLGFLPTYFTEHRKTSVAHKEPMAHVELSEKQVLLQGKVETRIGHLQGRNRSMSWHSPVWGERPDNPHENQCLWVVQGRGPVQIGFDFGGAGVLKCTLNCE